MERSPQHPLILVVEPSPTLRHIMQMTFQRAGGQTMLYHAPTPVLRAIEQTSFPPPDIAFITLTPNQTSYRLIRALGRRFTHLPIIALSPKGHVLSRIRARCAGATAHLSKPFTVEQLISTAILHSRH